jgi:hypothetical protein
LSDKRNALVHSLALPTEISLLEEANLPRGLAQSLVGRTVSVEVLPEEQPVTRRVDPDDVPLLIDPQGNYWNDYRPFRVFYTDEKERVWRFRKTWLPGLLPEPENLVSLEPSLSKSHFFHEALSLPTEWDLWEINIPWETAHRAGMRQVEVEVNAPAGHPPKVFWYDPSNSVWRIPHNWRRRLIRLPKRDMLISQEIPTEVAEEYAEKIVSVNYHPGSLCCLPDRYRFRDSFCNRWPARIRDCTVIEFGDAQAPSTL